jgi:hypothetical protein
MNKKEEKIEDIKTAKEFRELFVKKFGKLIPAFSLYEDVKFRGYLKYGANAIYLSEIAIPEMSEKVGKKVGLLCGRIGGMLWLTSEINPNGITGKNDIGRTFTIQFELKGLMRCTQRRWEDGCFIKFYGYARSMPSIFKQFRAWIKNDFSKFQSDIANKEYHWKKSY